MEPQAPRIKELPEDEQPREKLERRGASALSDAELLAIMLRTGVQGANAVQVGRQLLTKYQSLNGLGGRAIKELSTVKGVGRTKAMQLVAAFEMAKRMAQEILKRQEMATPQLIYDFLGAEMRVLQRESLRLVLLDTKLRMIAVEEISLGTVNESLAHPREILKPAVLHSAYGFVMVHNHPSGDPQPSSADLAITNKIREAAKLFQIQLLDHVIIGMPGYWRTPWYSFREMGLL